jgi:hypothetical protein
MTSISLGVKQNIAHEDSRVLMWHRVVRQKFTVILEERNASVLRVYK